MSATTRVSLQPAWILHRYPYRDSSLLLEVLSRDHGRLGLVARGARSAKSRWHSQLQLFRPLLLSFTLRSDLGTLTGADVHGGMPAVTGRHVFSGCYLNELLMRLLTRHDPHPGVFEAYQAALAQLQISEQPALRVFEKRLLESLGYGLLLDHEANSDTPVSADALYEYRLESGPVRCQSTDGSGIFIHGASLLALRDEVALSGRACDETRQLMRRTLELYLGARPLKTREVLRQMSSLAGRERTETAHAD